MPRLSRVLPSYRKHRPSGQAVVTLCGRDHYLGPHGTRASRQEYDRLVAEWLACDRAPVLEARGISVAELLIRYWKHASEYYAKDGKPTGETAAFKVALRYVRELYAATDAAEFGPLALKAVRLKMVEAGLARTTVNALVGRIKRMFRWAASEQLVPAEVWTALTTVEGLRRGKTPARETSPVLPIEDAVVDATLPHLPEVVADMVRLQRLTGMRPAELCELRPSDVDRAPTVWLYRPASHKTAHRGRGRIVPLGPKAQEVLLRYLARDAETHCFRPADSEAKRRAAQHANRKTPLSCGDRPGTNKSRRPKRPAGEKYTTCAYGRAIYRACDKAEIARWSPNRLRHSAATEIRQRFGLEAAQVVLGHAAPDMTTVYAEADLAKAVEVARLIG